MNNSLQLSDEVLRKAKLIQTKARFLVNDSFSGEYASAFKGRGIEFEEVRSYRYGDDVRSIDWKVSARLGKPFIKTYKDERELTLFLIVDVSASALFSSGQKTKEEVIAEIAALLGYAALNNNDRIGLIIFSDEIEHFIPPKRGRSHIWRIIRDILSFKANSKKTNINSALEFFSQIRKKKAIVFLISDFIDQGFEKNLSILGRKHDLAAICVRDKFELALPDLGFLRVKDLETGEMKIIETKNKSYNGEFESRQKESIKKLSEVCQEAKVGFIPIQSSDEYFDHIIQFFNKKKVKR